jgi:hypothetical protein
MAKQVAHEIRIAYANATVQSFQRKFDPTDQCKTEMNDYSRRYSTN